MSYGWIINAGCWTAVGALMFALALLRTHWKSLAEVETMVDGMLESKKQRESDGGNN